jgi:hypothetical protein
MIVKIPNEEGKTFQTNKGELSGNIWASYNLDLISSPGKIRVSPQTQVVATNLSSTLVFDHTSFGLPQAFVISDADSSLKIWAIAGAAMFYSYYTSTAINALTGWSIGGGSPPTTMDTNSDICEFNSGLIISLPTSLTRCAAMETWSASWNSISLTTGVPHPLCVSFNNLLLIGNGNNVYSVSIADVKDSTAIVLGTEYEVQWIRSTNSQVFIGTRNKKGGRAKVFTWDGYSENFNGDYKLNGAYSICGVVNEEICYTINETGELLYFNGGGFSQLAVFPNYKRKLNFSISTGAVRNWMAAQDNNIFINISPETTSGYKGLENMRAGVWCWNKDVGLHHCYSLTKGTDTDITDYGSPYIQSVGAIFPLQRTTGSFLMGAGIGTTGGGAANYYALVVRELENDTTKKCGYFITPQIQTQNVEEIWQKQYGICKKLLNSTDKIVVKYRTDESSIMSDSPMRCTWASTTTFTTTDGRMSNASVGNEVEIIEGEGSGLSTHITQITLLAGTYTVTIEDTVTAASGNIDIMIWNWTKIGTFNTQGVRNFEFPIMDYGSWIQIKNVLIWQGSNQIEKFIVSSKPQLKVE